MKAGTIHFLSGVATVLLAGPAGGAFGQTAPASGGLAGELARAKAEADRAVEVAAKSSVESYLLALRLVEKQRAEAGDYEGAARARDQAAQVEKPAASPASAGPASAVPRGGIVLAAAAARTNAGATTNRALDLIEFNKPDCTAQWELLKFEPGVYEIWMTYSLAPLVPPAKALTSDGSPAPYIKTGGVVDVGEVSALRQDLPLPKVEPLIPTGSWETFARLNLGTAEFKSKSLSLRVLAREAREGGLMRLRRVELIPAAAIAAEPVPVKPAEATPVKATLASLRGEAGKSIGASMLQVRKTYETKLEAMLAELAAAGNTDAAALVKAERDRVAAMLGGVLEDEAKPEDKAK